MRGEGRRRKGRKTGPDGPGWAAGRWPACEATGLGSHLDQELLAALPEWTVEGVSQALHDTAAALELGMGKIAQPLRVAITGTQVSPDISHTVYLAGRDEALKRIDAALIKVAKD